MEVAGVAGRPGLAFVVGVEPPAPGVWVLHVRGTDVRNAPLPAQADDVLDGCVEQVLAGVGYGSCFSGGHSGDVHRGTLGSAG